MKKQYDMHCNIAQTLNLIGDRWTLLILHAVREGRRTYKDLAGGAGGNTDESAVQSIEVLVRG